MSKEEKQLKYRNYKSAFMLDQRTMKRIGEFSHRIERIQHSLNLLLEFSKRLEQLITKEKEIK